METLISEKVQCYHCGDTCKDDSIHLEEKVFCCEGCKTVYEILAGNNMCTYYNLAESPGVTLKGKQFGGKYDYLANEEIVKRLLDFADEKFCKITFYVPAIHCSSCIWLLENLHRLHEGVTYSRVNFMKKEVSIDFLPSIVSVKQLVELLATLGYEPSISLEDYNRKKSRKKEGSLILKIGIVGFCTGNIMLLSFPDYFSLDQLTDNVFRDFFIWLNLLLSLPVVFYGASGYFSSAFTSLKHKILNIDVPISIGILTLFGRSVFETLFLNGAGYYDSLAGLVFFLLVGKWFQQKTYDHLSFNRDFSSYFPLAVTRLDTFKEENIPVAELKKGDRIRIRHAELIPADSILESESGLIDYSFVTGESEPVAKKRGDYLYAGGRQMGASVDLLVQKPVSQSYLTQLWNHEAFAKEKKVPVTRLAANFARYFTLITLSLAVLTATFWFFVDPSKMGNAFTAILIIACPCALTLSMPFTMGTVMSIFGRNKFYVKNPDVIQHMASISAVVFDKTGTLTGSSQAMGEFKGDPLTAEEVQLVKSLTSISTHPLSHKISRSIGDCRLAKVSFYKESPGNGIEGTVNGKYVRMGSAQFTGIPVSSYPGFRASTVALTINGVFRGYFVVKNTYREGIRHVVKSLKAYYALAVLSGDSDAERENLEAIFGTDTPMYFGKKPTEKLQTIQDLQGKGYRVAMIGDGLNDAGALRQSDVGIALTESVATFTPACDAIIEANQFPKLYDLLRFGRTSVNIVKVSFLLSMVYNTIGLSWAASGNLTPVWAAIFMPLSSLSVVLFAVGVTQLYAKRRGLW